MANRTKEHSRLTKKQYKNDEPTKLERSSVIAQLYHNVDFDNPEILSKYWPIYKGRINAVQWFKGKTTHSVLNLIITLINNFPPPTTVVDYNNYLRLYQLFLLQRAFFSGAIARKLGVKMLKHDISD